MPRLCFLEALVCSLCLWNILPVLKMTTLHLPIKRMQVWGADIQHGAIHTPSDTRCGLVPLGTQVASLGVNSVTLKSRETGTGTEPMSLRCSELLNSCPDVIWLGGGGSQGC